MTNDARMTKIKWRRCILRVSVFFPIFLSIFPAALQAADNVSILGSNPKWNVLEKYQGTITHDEFIRLIQDVYCTHGFAPDLVEINEKTARVPMNRESRKFFTLRFAENTAGRKSVPHLWRPARSLPPARAEKPLFGLRIALDPGHLGGKWAKMEERWFQVGDSKPVEEGDLTLRVARLLAPRLRGLGAKVSFVRNTNEPITPKRPDDFRELAKKILIKNPATAGQPRMGGEVLDPNDPEKEKTIRWQTEILFYRYSEIRRRAARVNFKLHPELVLCLHFNAEGWGDPNNPTLTDINHLHLLVNGSYLADELELDDERFEMIRRLFSRHYDEQLPLADTIAVPMARETAPPR